MIQYPEKYSLMVLLLKKFFNDNEANAPVLNCPYVSNILYWLTIVLVLAKYQTVSKRLFIEMDAWAGN